MPTLYNSRITCGCLRLAFEPGIPSRIFLTSRVSYSWLCPMAGACVWLRFPGHSGQSSYLHGGHRSQRRGGQELRRGERSRVTAVAFSQCNQFQARTQILFNSLSKEIGVYSKLKLQCVNQSQRGHSWTFSNNVFLKGIPVR